jgi:hypothetical protein
LGVITIDRAKIGGKDRGKSDAHIKSIDSVMEYFKGKSNGNI